MIEKTRPKLTLPDETKATINPSRNPYLNKLTMKLSPDYLAIGKFSLISPFKSNSSIAITQYLPLWRNEHFKLALLWQQDIKSYYNRSHLGVSTEYLMGDGWTLKSKNMFGGSFFSRNEIFKDVRIGRKNITVSALYSCFLDEFLEKFHTFGTSFSIENELTVSINRRLKSTTSLSVNYQRYLSKSLLFRMKYDTEVESIEEGVAEIGVGYYWSNELSTWLRVSAQSNTIEPNFSVQLEYQKVKSSHCFLTNIEYRNEKSVLYVGYKCPSFNIIFPIIGTDSWIPAAVGVAVYVLGYFKRRLNGMNREAAAEGKNRVEELKLIADKANELYRKEEAIGGLQIEEVYCGPKTTLNEFLLEANRLEALTHNPKYRNSITDGTTSFRFYVQKSELSLPQGNKLSMLGFDYQLEDIEEAHVFVRYVKTGKQEQRIWKIDEEILI